MKLEGKVEFCLMCVLFWNKFRYTESYKNNKSVPIYLSLVSLHS